ncbi:MAG: hypothetical protein RLZZ338_4045 [Cyanobacteriota bacterium]|jgi:HAD superfamily hydrolase (TIGR01509 family)
MLKAVLFDFNGVIINDESIHNALIEQLMIEENLRLKPGEFRQVCLGRSDRACLMELFNRRGRILDESGLLKLLRRKAKAYRDFLDSMESLPLYQGLGELLSQLQDAQLKLAVVSGAMHSEIEVVLTRAGLISFFDAIVAGDDILTSKPEPDGYLLAIQRLNQLYPDFHLQGAECLAIEDTLAGIQAAHNGGIPVLGVAHTYPLHILQRWATWSVDTFGDIELERLQNFFAKDVA